MGAAVLRSLAEPAAAHRSGIRTVGRAGGAAGCGSCRILPAKALLFSEGDPKGPMLMVLEGCIALTKMLGDGRRQIVDLVGPGDLLGFDGLEHHDCGAETITACRVQPWNPPPAHDEARDALLYAQANRALSRQRDHAFLLGRKSARERVASGLLRLAELLSEDGLAFSCPLTRQDLGDWLGLVIETVSRALSGLQRDGLIAIHHQNFEIRDLKRLTAAAVRPLSLTQIVPPSPRRLPQRLIA